MCEQENVDYTCIKFSRITCVNGKNSIAHVKSFCDYMCEWENGEQTCRKFVTITCVNVTMGITHVIEKLALHV